MAMGALNRTLPGQDKQSPEISAEAETAGMRKIFVVEDDADIARLLRHNLEVAGYRVSPRSVDVYVRKLRAKIEVDPEHPRYLKTVRGAGYRFEIPKK